MKHCLLQLDSLFTHPKMGLKHALILAVPISVLSGCSSTELAIGMTVFTESTRELLKKGKDGYSRGSLESNPWDETVDYECQISEEALDALASARERAKDNSDAMFLLDEAEATAGPPECNSVGFRMLFEKAGKHVWWMPDVDDIPVHVNDPRPLNTSLK